MFTIKKEFSFSSSHRLDGLPEDHPCSRLHGHNYKVIVELKAAATDSVGFVRDYRQLDFIKHDLDRFFDHQHLNDRLLFNPTSELIAKHLFETYKDKLPQLFSVTVKETDKTEARYEP